MKDFEVLVEDINPCGGQKYGKKTFLDVSAESPEAWVKQNAKFPLISVSSNPDGDPVFETGDLKTGIIIRYTFSE